MDHPSLPLTCEVLLRFPKRADPPRQVCGKFPARLVVVEKSLDGCTVTLAACSRCRHLLRKSGFVIRNGKAT
jgi:hypothetical protein